MTDLTGRILADVDNGQVVLLPGGAFTVTSDTDVNPNEYPDYIATLRQMLHQSWLMESHRRRAGGWVLRLTSIGEHMRRHANPDVYRSRHAFEVRDGQVGVVAQ
ncbi:hypothetical protein [Verrucosispora sp. NA02020]|uniref:hypothetical protein n=1 Tax=Verrucosispora sp. NA02020 TaxID=2742132 RepID=UPI0015922FC3|nr:hypothetical protein [Verrucosispora sp. NA02020]QKW15444.1 hypothetical protein HUT12_23530 [Verrucosispora sp. NA02020]